MQNLPKYRILIADDKKEICNSIETNVKILFEKYGVDRAEIDIRKAFTDHAYKHGKEFIDNGFVPNFGIFDLVFNGDTGVDLYKYIKTKITQPLFLCIYTGTEKSYHKRYEADVIASSSQGMVTVIQKPNISEVIDWFSRRLTKEYGLTSQYNYEDPFNML